MAKKLKKYIGIHIAQWGVGVECTEAASSDEAHEELERNDSNLFCFEEAAWHKVRDSVEQSLSNPEGKMIVVKGLKRSIKAR